MSDHIVLKKLNDVYLQIIADRNIVRELGDIFTFDVPGAHFMPKFKAGFWDGKYRAISGINCTTYVGLKDQLITEIKRLGYTYELVGFSERVNVSKAEVDSFIKSLNLPFEPHSHQMMTLGLAIANNRHLILSPTASGKSLSIHMISRWFSEHRKLIIVPSTGLVIQMKKDLISYGEDPDKIHIIMSGHEKETSSEIVISTWQSLINLKKKWFEQFKVVIGDEAHLYKAKCLTHIMESTIDCPVKIGLTGTLDGIQVNELILTGLFGPVKRVVSTSELMSAGKISELKVFSLVLGYNDDERKQIHRNKYEDEIQFIINNQRRLAFTAKLALGLEGNTLVLFQRVEKHGKPLKELVDKLNTTNRKVLFISGTNTPEERELVRATLLENNNVLLLASVGVFAVGINIPSIVNLVMAAPSKSQVRVLQSIGRALRKQEGKNHATLYDMADDLTYKGKANHTMNHFDERISMYTKEQFKFKVVNIQL